MSWRLPADAHGWVLLDATQKMAGPQIRNMATVGGNICNANHCADYSAILMVMNARVTLSSAEQRRFCRSRRSSPVPNKLLVAMTRCSRRFFAFSAPQRRRLRVRVEPVESNAIAVAGVAASLTVVDGVIRQVRIGFSAVAPTWSGNRAGRPSIGRGEADHAAEVAVKAAHPISDIRGVDFRQLWWTASCVLLWSSPTSVPKSEGRGQIEHKNSQCDGLQRKTAVMSQVGSQIGWADTASRSNSESSPGVPNTYIICFCLGCSIETSCDVARGVSSSALMWKKRKAWQRRARGYHQSRHPVADFPTPIMDQPFTTNRFSRLTKCDTMESRLR